MQDCRWCPTLIQTPKTHGTKQKLQPWPQGTINISHILITTHGFIKVIEQKHYAEKTTAEI